MAAGVVAIVFGLEVVERWEPVERPLQPSADAKLAQDREIELHAPMAAEPSETRGETQSLGPEPMTAEPEPLKKSTAAKERQPQPTATPRPKEEADITEVAPKESPAPPMSPKAAAVSRMAAAESEPSVVAPSPAPGRARRDKEEVGTLAVREVEQPRVQQMTSLQEAQAVDEVAEVERSAEVAAERRSAEADNDARVAFASLERRYPRSSKQSLRTTSTGASGSSEPELLAKCKNWRDYIEQYPDSAESIEARYRLARCSIDLFNLRPMEERRLQAVKDGEAFVEVAPEDERAEEIERLISSLRE
jgi:hypothetical protein